MFHFLPEDSPLFENFKMILTLFDSLLAGVDAQMITTQNSVEILKAVFECQLLYIRKRQTRTFEWDGLKILERYSIQLLKMFVQNGAAYKCHPSRFVGMVAKTLANAAKILDVPALAVTISTCLLSAIDDFEGVIDGPLERLGSVLAALEDASPQLLS